MQTRTLIKLQVIFIVATILLVGMGCILTQIASKGIQVVETNAPEVIETLQATEAEAPIPATEEISPTAEVSTEPPANPPAQSDAICSEVDGINICVPAGLADNLVVSTIPEVAGENVPPWEVAPQHYQIDLQGYKISSAFWKPQINLYPIDGFKALNPENMDMELSRLNEIMNTKPAELESIAFIPFVNAASILNARPHYFDDPALTVKGFGLITQFGQSFWPINNKDMLYIFQGTTNDGKYWISMTLPLTQRDLPADGEYIRNEDFETFANNFPTYIAGVRQSLLQAEPGTFNPDLGEIEKIILYSFTAK